MAYKIRFNYDNNKVYDLQDGFTIQDEYNETLDSATVVFRTYGEELTGVEPFDLVEIYDTDDKITKRYFLVDSYDDEVFSFNEDGTCDHKYTMLLFSQTKELERITLPNCSVTQPLTGSKKSVYYEIYRFCQVYMPRIKVFNLLSRFTYEMKYELDSNLNTMFSDIDCPELQWNEPTLREVLTDLMSVKNCIPVIKNNVLTYINLTEIGNAINTSNLNYSKKSNGSNDYVGELTIGMQNAIGQKDTVVCEKKSLRVTSGTFSSNEAVFITQHPIYDIVSCKISYYYSDIDNSASSPRMICTYHKDVDITQFIVEEDLFSIANGGRYTGSNIATAKNYQHYLLHYKRGNNTIEGWGSLMKYSWAASYATPTIGWIVSILGKGQINGGEIEGYGCGFAARGIGDYGNIVGIHVDLVYKTISDHKMHVGKYVANHHPENRTFDGQTSSYVDVNRQSVFEYAKVNRLGNRIREIHGIYFNEDDIPELGDTLDENEILFHREIEYLDGQFTFVGYLTENYILKDYFTGVQAKKREWQFAKEEDALTRNEVYKRYIEFSFSRKQDGFSTDWTFELGGFIDGLLSGSGTEIKYIAVQTTTDNEGTLPSSTYAYQLDLDKAVQGMSMCFNFGFIDNVMVDYYMNYDSTGEVYYNNLYKYVDSNAECKYIFMYLASAIDPTDGAFTFDADGTARSDTSGNSKMTTIVNNIIKKPHIRLSTTTYPIAEANGYLGNQSLISTYKDNREILKMCLQYEYCSDTENIIVTPEFIKKATYFAGSVNTNGYKYYVSYTEKYKIGATKALGSQINDMVVTMDKIESFMWQIGFYVPNNIVSLGIEDANGNLLIGINATTTNNNVTIHANLLASRDTKIYYNVANQIPIGDLTNSAQELLTAYMNIHDGNTDYQLLDSTNFTRNNRSATSTRIIIPSTDE